jgi:hypothetical protein
MKTLQQEPKEFFRILLVTSLGNVNTLHFRRQVVIDLPAW